MFPFKWTSIKGVVVKANHKFTYGTWMTFNDNVRCYSGSVEENGIFRVENSVHINSSN